MLSRSSVRSPAGGERMSRRQSLDSFRFDWLRALARDRRMSHGETKNILTFIVLNNMKMGDDTFCVRQVTVAENLGVAARTVRRTYRRAMRLGYLELSEERQRGRGHHKADTYRLTLPEIGSRPSTCSDDEIGDSAFTSSDYEIGDTTVPYSEDEIGDTVLSSISGDKYRTAQTEIGDSPDRNTGQCRPEIPDSAGRENACLPADSRPLWGLYTGFSSGVHIAGYDAREGAGVREGLSGLFGSQPVPATSEPPQWVEAERIEPPADVPLCIDEGCDAPAVEDGFCGRHLALSRVPKPQHRPIRRRRRGIDT